MNARGLTELVMLSVGLQLGLISRDLYSLMVAMAVITTAMTGPLLNLRTTQLTYPDTRRSTERPGILVP